MAGSSSGHAQGTSVEAQAAASYALLTTPVEELRGVGPKLAATLARLRITRLVDLLLHLPTRYQDRTRVVPIGTLIPGQECVVEGTVEGAQVKFGRRRALVAALADGSGILHLRWFHFSRAMEQRLVRGARLRCFGAVRRGRDRLEMVHPEFSQIADDGIGTVEETLTPIYPVTEGITQPRIRALIDLAIDAVQAGAGTGPVTAPHGPGDLPGWFDAVRFLHHPPPDTDLATLIEGSHPAQKRLAFDELLAQRISLKLARSTAEVATARPFAAVPGLRRALMTALGFELTGAQRRVLEEIDADLGASRPMLRLLQGDVGSGKTAVAALAALPVLGAGAQVALMAPTELLARQHAATFGRWFTHLGIPVVSLSGQAGAREKRDALARLGRETPLLATGTHALFQEGVNFADLGLVIIDEQHRFGVNQRLALRDKGRGQTTPHQLVMTATPIPRTLAMSLYADLDVSTIDELPPSRKPVRTRVVSEERREEIVARVEAALAEGRQVYWVCPLIDESESLSAQAATEIHADLAERLAVFRVGLVHGRMADAEKTAAMQAFRDGEVRLLVATTVIEVGVDVPDATLMIIENAERLGLAQLHQLRGRVGRGGTQSDCLLLYQTPLSAMARERLAIMRETNDGFRIAARDLELRGPGEVLGVRQAGVPDLRIADLVRDADLHGPVAQTADELVETAPDDAERLMQLWLGNVLKFREA